MLSGHRVFLSVKWYWCINWGRFYKFIFLYQFVICCKCVVVSKFWCESTKRISIKILPSFQGTCVVTSLFYHSAKWECLNGFNPHIICETLIRFWYILLQKEIITMISDALICFFLTLHFTVNFNVCEHSFWSCLNTIKVCILWFRNTENRTFSREDSQHLCFRSH